MRDGRYRYQSKYAYDGRKAKKRVFDRGEPRDGRYQEAYHQNYDDLPAVGRGPSIMPPSNDSAAVRSKRDELWGRHRKEVEVEKIEGIYADLKAREEELEEQLKERKKEERKRDRNNEGRGGVRGRPGRRRDFSEPLRGFGKEGGSYQRAPSVSSLRGITATDGSLERLGEFDSYNKRRRNQ